MKKLKVVHLVSGELDSGAGRGAYWLHKGLIDCDVDSIILTNSNRTFGEREIISFYPAVNKISERIKASIENFFIRKSKGKNLFFSTGLFGLNLIKNKHIADADIIHVHWTSLNFISLYNLIRIDKSTVWTLRDMWLFTGGCHYSMDCKRYESTGCMKCPMINSSFKYDISWISSRLKENLISRKSFNIVGISKYISFLAKNSKVMEGKEINHIPNCVDEDVFKPVDKEIARKIIGIETDKKVIIVGARRLKDAYKGTHHLYEIINKIDSEKYFFVFFGASSDSDFVGLNIEYIRLGYIYDPISLRLVYSSGDVFLATSTQEAFGKTIVESMMCGTPVVCFDNSGPGEIVEHMQNGYKASFPHIDDMCNGIEEICSSRNYNSICSNAVYSARQRFSKKTAAESYIKLYKKILNPSES